MSMNAKAILNLFDHLCNEARNVVGLMPHAEHAVEPLTGSVDGGLLFESAARLAGAAG